MPHNNVKFAPWIDFIEIPLFVLSHNLL